MVEPLLKYIYNLSQGSTEQGSNAAEDIHIVLRPPHTQVELEDQTCESSRTNS